MNVFVYHKSRLDSKMDSLPIHKLNVILQDFVVQPVIARNGIND